MLPFYYKKNSQVMNLRVFYLYKTVGFGWLRFVMEGELMPTYIYKGCIVKENRDGLLQNVQQKTVPVLGCSGLCLLVVWTCVCL